MHTRIWVLLSLLLLPVFTGCLTAENRLYGEWRQEGLTALATGLAVIFNRDGTVDIYSNFGAQTAEWTVIKAEGDNYEIGWKSPSSEVVVSRDLRFLDDDHIETSILDNVGGVRLARVVKE